ncbi:hypothetical protein DICVIV_13404 [Dictyocaulus viviparus]|uniref:Uncharacterized protein n=1 Tax=Dictyocaulus viviparus TaxID=29172 RepID=A0A0D8X7V8_DICVI|nr:hypothetical protein DICVIV_13404 [Dictyocaulus viviparus]
MIPVVQWYVQADMWLWVLLSSIILAKLCYVSMFGCGCGKKQKTMKKQALWQEKFSQEQKQSDKSGQNVDDGSDQRTSKKGSRTLKLLQFIPQLVQYELPENFASNFKNPIRRIIKKTARHDRTKFWQESEKS